MGERQGEGYSMEHNDIRDKLSEYIDGSMTGREKAAIEEHLKTCKTCNDVYRELSKTIEHIKTIEDVEPPAWMTKKIMANVRSSGKEKKSFFYRLFYPLAIKVPVQAVAVIFLAISAYYIYRSIQPVSVPREGPIQEFAAKEESPSAGTPKDKLAKTDESSPSSKKIPQAPEYKALDMKQEYEKPAPPVPARPTEQSAVTAQESAKRESPISAKEESAPAKMPATPKAKAVSPLKAGNAEPSEQRAAARMAAPAMMAEQASGTAPLVKSGAGMPRAEDKDAEEIISVMEHFIRHDLPDAMKTKGLQYSARRVPEDLASLQWLRDSTVYRSSTCSRKYLVDVEFSGKSSKYLYCYEQGKPRLLAIYELKAGTWVENGKQ